MVVQQTRQDWADDAHQAVQSRGHAHQQALLVVRHPFCAERAQGGKDKTAGSRAKKSDRINQQKDRIKTHRQRACHLEQHAE